MIDILGSLMGHDESLGAKGRRPPPQAGKSGDSERRGRERSKGNVRVEKTSAGFVARKYDGDSVVEEHGPFADRGEAVQQARAMAGHGRVAGDDEIGAGRSHLPSGIPTPQQALSEGISTLQRMGRAYDKKGAPKAATIARGGVTALQDYESQHSGRFMMSAGGRTFDSLSQPDLLSRGVQEIVVQALQQAEAAYAATDDAKPFDGESAEVLDSSLERFVPPPADKDGMNPLFEFLLAVAGISGLIAVAPFILSSLPAIGAAVPTVGAAAVGLLKKKRTGDFEDFRQLPADNRFHVGTTFEFRAANYDRTGMKNYLAVYEPKSDSYTVQSGGQRLGRVVRQGERYVPHRDFNVHAGQAVDVGHDGPEIAAAMNKVIGFT